MARLLPQWVAALPANDEKFCQAGIDAMKK
jgi:hypothetical protein